MSVVHSSIFEAFFVDIKKGSVPLLFAKAEVSGVSFELPAFFNLIFFTKTLASSYTLSFFSSRVFQCQILVKKIYFSRNNNL